MKSAHKIDILMATYNGEKYLQEQIDSILDQSYTNWLLTIHDDNSKDGTVDIIHEYTNRYPDKIKFIDDDLACGGASENFSFLLSQSAAEYLMFCDQDDIWLPTKIETAYKKMTSVENDNKSLPIMVFTDLTVVDKNLSVISNSMMKYQNKSLLTLQSLPEMLVENIVTGCTVMINKKAKEIALPIPPDAMMHDWWIALRIKQHQGIIKYIDKSQILYRQHDNNDTGATKFSLLRLFTKISSIFKYKKMAIALNLSLSISSIVYYKTRIIIAQLLNKEI